MRALYEPYAQALSEYLGVAIPRWVTEPKVADPKKTDQWTKVASLRANVEGSRRKQEPSVRARSGAGFPGIDPATGTRVHDEEHRH